MRLTEQIKLSITYADEETRIFSIGVRAPAPDVRAAIEAGRLAFDEAVTKSLERSQQARAAAEADTPRAA